MKVDDSIARERDQRLLQNLPIHKGYAQIERERARLDSLINLANREDGDIPFAGDSRGRRIRQVIVGKHSDDVKSLAHQPIQRVRRRRLSAHE